MKIFSTAPEGNEMAELENARYSKILSYILFLFFIFDKNTPNSFSTWKT